MTQARQWNAQIFPNEQRKIEDRNRPGNSWWVDKDREAFRQELQAQKGRMSGARSEKVEGFEERAEKKGPLPWE